MLQKEHKHKFTFYVIVPHCQYEGSWNTSSCKTKSYLSYKAIIMAADDQGINNHDIYYMEPD